MRGRGRSRSGPRHDSRGFGAAQQYVGDEEAGDDEKDVDADEAAAGPADEMGGQQSEGCQSSQTLNV